MTILHHLSRGIRMVERDHRAQLISCLDDLIKTTTFILTFYSNDDS